MKVFKKILLPIIALTALATSNSNAMENPDKYLFQNYSKKFTADKLEKCQVSDELKSALDEQFKGRRIIHNPLVSKTRKVTLNGKDYYVKLETSRIIGAELINELAQDYGLDTVKAPIKRIFGEYVVVPTVSTTNDPFSLKQIKHIYKVIKKSAYVDTHRENIFNTKEGVTYFLDTEKTAFADAHSLKEWQAEEMQSTLGVLKMQLPMTDEARAWLTDKMKQKTTGCC
jgi:hypothetical protein